MIRQLIRCANSLINLLVFMILFLAGAYACYALWDNYQVYHAAEDVQSDMRRLKPVAEEDGDGLSFEELLKINPDVCAWITMDNTGIDYPVLQGKTNLTYINTDVYGKFALAGSIFLDVRCDRTFSATYSLIYGHHMEKSLMFGDLDLYREPEFFGENRTGVLLLPDGTEDLKTIGCLVTEASDEMIFEPELCAENIQALMEYVRENALVYDETAVQAVEQLMVEAAENDSAQSPRIVVLSTCATEYTDARTVLITVIREDALIPLLEDNGEIMVQEGETE